MSCRSWPQTPSLLRGSPASTPCQQVGLDHVDGDHDGLDWSWSWSWTKTWWTPCQQVSLEVFILPMMILSILMTNDENMTMIITIISLRSDRSRCVWGRSCHRKRLENWTQVSPSEVFTYFQILLALAWAKAPRFSCSVSALEAPAFRRTSLTSSTSGSTIRPQQPIYEVIRLVCNLILCNAEVLFSFSSNMFQFCCRYSHYSFFFISNFQTQRVSEPARGGRILVTSGFLQQLSKVASLSLPCLMP